MESIPGIDKEASFFFAGLGAWKVWKVSVMTVLPFLSSR